MKVWLIAENWPPRQGGIENYLGHVAEQLGHGKHQVTVVAPWADSEALKKQHSLSFNVIRKRFFWPLVRPKWLPLFITLWQQARSAPPDIIICGKGLFEGLVGYYFKKHLGIPYVVCTYGMEIGTWSASWRVRRTLARVLRAAAKVTYINDVTKELLQKLGVSDTQLHKLLPGVDGRFLREVPAALIQGTTEHYGVRQPYVISVGRLIPRKGFDTLIEAFSQLDQTKYGNLKLVIVGDGPDKARLTRIVADNYMQTTVIWLSGVPDKHLPALYAGAHLFALTPKDIAGDIEGFGIVYLEAAAMGIAALGTRSGGVSEAVIDEKTGLLVEPGDVTSVTAGLVRLLRDTALRQKLGSTARARVQHEFQWSARDTSLSRLIQPFS